MHVIGRRGAVALVTTRAEAKHLRPLFVQRDPGGLTELGTVLAGNDYRKRTLLIGAVRVRANNWSVEPAAVTLTPKHYLRVTLRPYELDTCSALGRPPGDTCPSMPAIMDAYVIAALPRKAIGRLRGLQLSVSPERFGR